MQVAALDLRPRTPDLCQRMLRDTELFLTFRLALFGPKPAAVAPRRESARLQRRA